MMGLPPKISGFTVMRCSNSSSFIDLPFLQLQSSYK
jgi:hypothetical protein